MHDLVANRAWLFQHSINTVRWLASLYRKVFRIAPAAATIALILQVIAHASQILAFLLPLKIVILLGSETVPWYFREIFGAPERDRLVGLLAVGAIAFYLLHLVAQSRR